MKLSLVSFCIVTSLIHHTHGLAGWENLLFSLIPQNAQSSKSPSSATDFLGSAITNGLKDMAMKKLLKSSGLGNVGEQNQSPQNLGSESYSRQSDNRGGFEEFLRKNVDPKALIQALNDGIPTNDAETLPHQSSQRNDLSNEANEFNNPHNEPNEFNNPHNEPNEFNNPHNEPNEFNNPHNEPNEFNNPHNEPNEFKNHRTEPKQFNKPRNEPNQLKSTPDQSDMLSGIKDLLPNHINPKGLMDFLDWEIKNDEAHNSQSDMPSGVKEFIRNNVADPKKFISFLNDVIPNDPSISPRQPRERPSSLLDSQSSQGTGDRTDKDILPSITAFKQEMRIREAEAEKRRKKAI